MKFKNKLAIVLALSTITTVAMAKGPSFDYVDVRAVMDTDDTGTSFYQGEKLQGVQLKISKELSHEFFTDLTFKQIDDKVESDSLSQDVTIETVSIGLGYNHKVTKFIDMYAKVSFEGEKVKALGLSQEDTGHGIAVGFRNKTASWLELSAEIFYKNVVEESETGFDAGLQLVFNDMFSIGLGFTMLENEERASAGLRFTF